MKCDCLAAAEVVWPARDVWCLNCAQGLQSFVAFCINYMLPAAFEGTFGVVGISSFVLLSIRSYWYFQAVVPVDVFLRSGFQTMTYFVIEEKVGTGDWLGDASHVTVSGLTAVRTFDEDIHGQSSYLV